MPSKNRGFTVIELLIVVVIIGILATIAAPKFSNTKEKAYSATMKGDLRNLAVAQLHRPWRPPRWREKPAVAKRRLPAPYRHCHILT